MNERRSAPGHSIPALFVFLLLGIFAVFSLVLIMFSAQAYKSTVDRTSQHNEERILASFVRNNLRTADLSGGIRYETDSTVPRLVIADPEDEEYAEFIYVYEGKLCELYTEIDKDFNPEAGEEICSADDLDATIENGLLHVTVTANGEEHVTSFALRCEEDRA